MSQDGGRVSQDRSTCPHGYERWTCSACKVALGCELLREKSAEARFAIAVDCFATATRHPVVRRMPHAWPGDPSAALVQLAVVVASAPGERSLVGLLEGALTPHVADVELDARDLASRALVEHQVPEAFDAACGEYLARRRGREFVHHRGE